MINQNNSPTVHKVSVFSRLSVASGKTKLSHDAPIENISNFDQAKIIEHYRNLREAQQEQLAGINMQEEMKRKLFGFSEVNYLTNEVKAADLFIENHPLRGRILQTLEKYEQYLIQKKKEKDIRSDRSLNSISKIYTENKADFSSDLQLHIHKIFNQEETHPRSNQRSTK